MGVTNSIIYRSFIALLLAATAFLTGCASPSNPQAMAASTTLEHRHTQTASIRVTGGSETSLTGASQISDAAFSEAVTSSITTSGLFGKILGVDAADYLIEVYIARLQQPIMGLEMTVTIETNWKLTHRPDSKVVWQKAILTGYTAKFGDALAGPTRLRLATEGAPRTNIEQALKEISALTLL